MVISCYVTPSYSIIDFQANLNAIEDAAQHTSYHLIIVGDFNVKVMEWGTPTTNYRDRKILGMAAKLSLPIEDPKPLLEGQDVTTQSPILRCCLKDSHTSYVSGK